MSRESAFVNIGTGFSSLDILQKSGVREDYLKGIRDLQGEEKEQKFYPRHSACAHACIQAV